MSIFNSVFSSLTGKRLNDDSQRDQSSKKQRVHHEAIITKPLATNSTYDGADNIIAKENHANKLIMAFVQNQSKIETINDTPRAYLTKNLYSTPLVDKIMDSSAFDYNERQVWSLAALLFEQEVIGSSNDPLILSPAATAMTAKQQRRLRNWIRSTVVEELQRRNLLDVEMDTADDWKRAFYYMSSGQVVQACEMVQQLGDDALATMMVVHFQQEDDVCDAAEKQVSYWQQRGLFDSLPLYRQKMWYVLQGQLGYVDHIKTVVTQDLPWPQTLLLYALYGGQRGHFGSGLSAYHTLTSATGAGVIGIHRLRARKHTARVPSDCLWYTLLQWWSSSLHPSANNSVYRKGLEMDLPLHCRWSNGVMNFIVRDLNTWLSMLDFTHQGTAIQIRMEKEHYLSRQLQIPSEWITDSKALYALNHQLYDKEVEYYLEANENAKARNAILNHMLPALFLDGKRTDTIITYLTKLTTLFPDDVDLQQTIDILFNIHNILNDYPHIIKQSSSTSVHLTNMVNELTLAIQNLTFLKESTDLHDSILFSKVAGQLISTGALFMNDEQLNTLIETCPVEICSDQTLLTLLSQAMSSSITSIHPTD
ncbi:hypothetical protein BCR42DRAFT_433610 [Absidia repens]|uniref:Nuclear pore complex protein NUP96 C-terminal domain-containing protein n=1 Tax=Absidia repens TaxID=90262 RepID=A0A1X2IU27_9FUNG|nr:hypothetical protein BCR42DRAFT_433610 [Absidia repens]